MLLVLLFWLCISCICFCSFFMFLPLLFVAVFVFFFNIFFCCITYFSRVFFFVLFVLRCSFFCRMSSSWIIIYLFLLLFSCLCVSFYVFLTCFLIPYLLPLPTSLFSRLSSVFFLVMYVLPRSYSPVSDFFFTLTVYLMCFVFFFSML